MVELAKTATDEEYASDLGVPLETLKKARELYSDGLNHYPPGPIGIIACALHEAKMSARPWPLRLFSRRPR